MLIGTHALLPVSVCLGADHVRLLAGRERWFGAAGLVVVAVFGVLPDLCSPHLSLADRYDSWSHTTAFLAGVVLMAATAGSFFETGLRGVVTAACWLAAALHLAADALSGGIVWLAPWREQVLGGSLIPFRYWLWADLGFAVLVMVQVRLNRWLEGRAIRRGSGWGSRPV